MIQVVVYRLIGVILLTVGLVFMPGEWWIKALIWFGIGLLVDRRVVLKEAYRKNK